mmetsp:Transcript_490/g.961  ORF Transcript_490/g.961 Transcript_490/m.961 type:complete len:209 (+) Transcript_490:108-734(+)
MMAGGFGRFQYFSTTTLILSFLTGGQIVNQLPFFEVYPDYQCLDSQTQTWIDCDRENDICKPDLSPDLWRINYDSTNSFHNWVDQDKLDLTCVDSSKIALIASGYFVGFAISSGIVPFISDRFGRKWPNLVSIMFQTLAYVFIFFTTSLNSTIIFYIVVGLSAGGRASIGTNYSVELVPNSKKTLVATLTLVLDSTQLIYQAVFYHFN